jgi:competence protein CoiA
MVLFAKDDLGHIIDAWDADKTAKYRCAECGLEVRLRKIPYRLPHFYHLRKTPSCRSYGKSERHLQIQLAIQRALPRSVLEKPFPPIQRIADVAFGQKIFEIQCSLISDEEVHQRTQEYKALGFEVIWVLDDRLFNQWRLRPGEKTLRKKTSCFVHYPKMHFYQQKEKFQGKKRLLKGARRTVRLCDPLSLPEIEEIPEKTEKTWRFLKRLMNFFQRK